jgi:hypothetical protein
LISWSSDAVAALAMAIVGNCGLSVDGILNMSG